MKPDSSESTMTTDDAMKAGAMAYTQGTPAAPALNAAFIAAACASAVPTAALLDAYGRGWTVAHLAADAPLKDMPSVIEFNRLMAT
jgi:phage-related minor tail protein